MGDFDREPRKRSFGNRSFGNRGFGNRSFGPREMHKAVCSKCKKECEVPFKPTPGKDVFCKECFATVRKERESI